MQQSERHFRQAFDAAGLCFLPIAITLLTAFHHKTCRPPRCTFSESTVIKTVRPFLGCATSLTLLYAPAADPAPIKHLQELYHSPSSLVNQYQVYLFLGHFCFLNLDLSLV
jgi:hypothetical protein